MSVPFLTALIDIRPAPLLVLDIGAWSEGRDRYAPLVEQKLAQVTAFEPMEVLPAELAARGVTRVGRHYLGDGGPARLHETRYPGCSSLYPPNPAVIDCFPAIGTRPPHGNFEVLAVHEVQTSRLDDVLTDGFPDFIKIDVQGAELDVLRHGTRAMRLATVIETEVEFVPVYLGQPLFGDMQRFMQEQGFLLHKLIDSVGLSMLHRSGPEPVSQLLWCDAVFVRDFSRLDGYDAHDLLRTALMLHDMYGSYDLVARLLAEHDRRDGTDYAASYVAALAAGGWADGPLLNRRPRPY